jgi:hypothetical protein
MQYNHNIHISLYSVVKRHLTSFVKIRSIINTIFLAEQTIIIGVSASRATFIHLVAKYGEK